MKSILVVDDSHTVRQLILACFAGDHFTVEEAEDGVEGLALAKSGHFDLIFTDIYMPNMLGTDLIQKLRSLEKYKQTPIYIITVDSDQKIKDKVKELGATGWILKPINYMQLTAVIKEIFGDCAEL